MFRGSMVALVTPMDNSGAIDLEALGRLIEWHIKSNTDALVVLGTTGESASITQEERYEILKFTVKQVDGRLPVIAGTGVTSTQNSIAYTKQAMELGVDACLLMAPAYVKPTQEGLYQHYKAIAEAAAIPQILYNVPGRTASDIYPETVARLSHIPNIVAIKEASGELARVGQILEQTEGRLVVLCGEDKQALQAMYMGARGVISVTANVAPQAMAELCAAVSQQDKPLATLLDDKLQHLHEALFYESNPIPVKWALAQLGLMDDGIRLPLTPLSARYHDEVRQAMIGADLL